MELIKLKDDFAICKIDNVEMADLCDKYAFLSKTDDEISLVCRSSRVPQRAIKTEHGYKALRISGELDFGMVGVIAKISAVLAQAGIAIFVISTYNTDYIFIKDADFEKGADLLAQNGYNIAQ